MAGSITKITTIIAPEPPAAPHYIGLIGGVFDWQTFVAGLLAILAALIGAGFVLHQTQTTARIESKRVKRRRNALRAAMPLSLSAFMGYARRCGYALHRLMMSTDADQITRAAAKEEDWPSVPAETIAFFVEAIEVMPNEIGEALTDLLSATQIQSVRISEYGEDNAGRPGGPRNIPKTELETYIIDTAGIYARAEALLDYARRDSETVASEPECKSILRALFLMGFDLPLIFHPARTRVSALVVTPSGAV